MEATPMKLSDIIGNGGLALSVLAFVFIIHVLVYEMPIVGLTLVGIILFVLISGMIITYIQNNR